MKLNEVEYKVDGKPYVGFLADGSNGRKVPGILVAHEGGGMTGHPKDRAKMLAELGYVAFAMDTFGEKITSREQAIATITGLMGDLPAEETARTALDIVKAQPGVDAKRTAAIGFCFGGTTVLELARSGADVGCIVGFHSGLQTSAPQDAKNIKGKVLVCLGAVDPIIPPEQREAFVKCRWAKPIGAWSSTATPATASPTAKWTRWRSRASLTTKQPTNAHGAPCAICSTRCWARSNGGRRVPQN
jgi:dienelactone hydrolase